MSAYRPIGAFLICLLASNFTFLFTLFVPTIFSEIGRTSWSELASGVMFLSFFSVPAIFMGGLSFGLGFWGLARHLQLSQSIPAMAAFGAVAGVIYAAFAGLLIGGLSMFVLALLLPAGIAGAVAGVLWTMLFERQPNA